MRPIVASVGPNGIFPAAGPASGTSAALIRFDEWAPGPISITAQATAGGTFSISYSNDDPNSPTNPVAVGSMNWVPSTLVGAGTSQSLTWAFVPLFAQLTQVSGPGTVTATFVQAGVAPY
jgi:hypothetical protein